LRRATDLGQRHRPGDVARGAPISAQTEPQCREATGERTVNLLL